jgi:flavin reductase ActVB
VDEFRSPVAEQHDANMRDGLREAMTRLTGGVVVLTTWISGRPWGLTVSSCCSLSMDPPLLLACLGNQSATTKAVLEQGCFGVNVIGADQIEMARRGAVPGVPKFIDDLVRAESHMGSPVIKGSLASIHCELYNALVVGDHTIAIGRVGDVELGQLRDPLLYFHRTFRSLRAAVDLPEAAPEDA